MGMNKQDTEPRSLHAIRANKAEWSAIKVVGIARLREWALKTAAKLSRQSKDKSSP